MNKVFQVGINFLKSKLMVIIKRAKCSIKVITKFFVKIVVITSLFGFAVVPFLHNSIDHDLAQWIWYPACMLSILDSIIVNVRNKRPVFKNPIFEFLGKCGEFIAYATIASVFVINYYEIDYAWMWVIFGIVAFCVPIFFFLLWNLQIKNENLSDDAKQKASLNIIKSIFLYWFIDLFYMSIFNNWLIPTFVFGILAVVIIFFNLVNAFLNGAKVLRFFIVLEMIIALIMSGYMIFIIPNESLQEIVLTIVAALYGGILTLVGVAWTIKQTHEDDTKKDVQRNTPYFRKNSGHVISSLKIEVYPNGNYYLGVELISDAIFIFRGALCDKKLYSQKRLIAPKTSFDVVLNVQDYNEIALIGSDIFGNIYRFDLDIRNKQSSPTKIIESIGLPIDISDEEIPCTEENEDE